MKPKNILIITGWSFEDALVQNYTLPYVYLIKSNLPPESKIFLYTQNKPSFLNKIAENNQQIQSLKTKNIFVIKSKYVRFGFLALFNYCFSFLKLLYLCYSKKISVIHTWCTPAGGLGYLLTIFINKKLILDSFEPHALPMMEGNVWKKKSVAFKLLFFLEKKQLQRADEVICTVEKMIEHSQNIYGIKKDRYFSKPACVDLNLFSYKNIKNQQLLSELNLNDSIVCVYVGKFDGLYLTNEIFDFFKIAAEYFGEKFKVLLLTSHSDKEINNYIVKSGLRKEAVVKRFVSHTEIPNYIGLADFAISPLKPLPSRRYCTPIKNAEYWALGLPIVITKNISDDSDIIKENKIGSVLKDLNESSYLTSIKEIDDLLKNNSRSELYKKIRPIAEKYRNFSIAKEIYRKIYS